MDQLSPAEKAEVERYVNLYPALRQDLLEIEKSLELVARSTSRPAPQIVKRRILDEIRNTSASAQHQAGKRTSGSAFGIWSIAAILLGGVLMILGYLWIKKNNEVDALRRSLMVVRDSCEQNSQQLTEQLRLLQQLTYPENRIIPFAPTPGFASTDLYLHHNEQTRRNFIQVRNLPAKAENQQYQLWALKFNQPPAPLDVFDAPATGLIEVAYVEDTQTYAITIEPRGGRDTPTLDNLIGTVTIVE